MSVLAVETATPTRNPLDIVEEIVAANEWPFDRVSDDEMVVEISGRWCDYRLYFVWQEEISALQFSCQFDMKVQHARRSAVHDLLAEVNAKLWIGHFDVCNEEHTPMFRQTTLLRGSRGANTTASSAIAAATRASRRATEARASPCRSTSPIR